MTRSFFAKIPGGEEWDKAEVPVGRLGDPEDVAEAVAWLCSAAASYVVGRVMLVDGGWVAN